eukprot:g14015.t1
MVLHYVNGSIPSFRVQILLHHLGLDVEHRRLYVMSDPRPTKTAEFLSDVNSRGEAPVLEIFDENEDDSSDDSSKTGASESGESRSFKLRESLAILEFLHEERLAVEKGNAGLQLTNSDSTSTAAADPNRNFLHAYARTRQILHESERMRFLIKVLSKFYKPEFQRLVRTRNQRDDPAYVNAVAEVRAGLTAIVSELRIWEEEHLVWLPAAGAAAREPNGDPETNLSISAVSFLGGSRELTIADCAFFPILAFLKQRGFPLQSTIVTPAAAAASSSSSTSTSQTQYLNPQFPKLAAYFAKMAQLRAVRRASPFNWNVWDAEVAPGANCWKMATDLIAVEDGAGRGGGNLKQ